MMHDCVQQARNVFRASVIAAAKSTTPASMCTINGAAADCITIVDEPYFGHRYTSVLRASDTGNTCKNR